MSGIHELAPEPTCCPPSIPRSAHDPLSCESTQAQQQQVVQTSPPPAHSHSHSHGHGHGHGHAPHGAPLPDGLATGASMAALLKRALRIEGPQLVKRSVTIKKNVRESLGMRIGGGIGSNEGDTPIYIANIHPHGCIGKSKQMKVRNRS